MIKNWSGLKKGKCNEYSVDWFVWEKRVTMMMFVWRMFLGVLYGRYDWNKSIIETWKVYCVYCYVHTLYLIASLRYSDTVKSIFSHDKTCRMHTNICLVPRYKNCWRSVYSFLAKLGYNLFHIHLLHSIFSAKQLRNLKMRC